MASGIVTADAAADARERRYSLPPVAAEVLTDAASLNYAAPLARMFAASPKALPRRAYPSARVNGYDLDGPAIDMARRHAEEAGVSDRVSFAAPTLLRSTLVTATTRVSSSRRCTTGLSS